MNFTDRLALAVRTCGNPVVVGLDPRWQHLPESLRDDTPAGDFAAQACKSAREW